MERADFTIRIKGPYLLEKAKVDFNFDEGAAFCTIEFDGLGEGAIEVTGIDGIHALALATDDLDKYLKGMCNRYEFFWPTGEPYFDA